MPVNKSKTQEIVSLIASGLFFSMWQSCVCNRGEMAMRETHRVFNHPAKTVSLDTSALEGDAVSVQGFGGGGSAVAMKNYKGVLAEFIQGLWSPGGG
jgi:hypothetical protein